ncbi:MAG: DUF2252 domain-containing protein, partial [Thermomicrobiales bacterium]
RNRLNSDLPHRYGRLLTSPFAFLRGAAIVMAHDLVDTPVTGLRAWICGDAHLGNIGGYATPERNLVLDLNDFDETLEGPWEFDVKRLATSIVVAGRSNGLSDAGCRDAAESSVRSYRKRMRELAEMRFLDAWYTRLDAEDASEHFDNDEVIKQAIAKGRRRTNAGSMTKLTEAVGEEYRLINNPPLMSHRTQSLNGRMPETWAGYRASLTRERRMLLDRYRIIDVALRVVGVGSVGLRCFVILLLGNDDDDPLFLQLKEARPSVLETFGLRTPFANHGKRVVTGQRIMQAASDLFLGWTRVGSVDYYVRQLRDMKFSVPLEKLDTRDVTAYADLCGRTLARAHACSTDPAWIGGYLGRGDGFDHAVSDFAVAYADQTERDYESLVAAVGSGKVAAERGL